MDVSFYSDDDVEHDAGPVLIIISWTEIGGAVVSIPAPVPELSVPDSSGPYSGSSSFSAVRPRNVGVVPEDRS
jgi:hypothetical protein